MHRSVGLGGALREGNAVRERENAQRQFERYLVPRFRDLPELDIHLLDRPDLPSAGGGETPIIAIVPAIANGKVNLSFGVALTRGILCNVLVCLAVWLCFSARSVTDKILAIVFPITAFVASGFEHSIANMYFIPMGMLLRGQPSVLAAAGTMSGAPSALTNLTWSGFIVKNLIPVTIGNIIGGAFFVGALYWSVYVMGSKKDNLRQIILFGKLGVSYLLQHDLNRRYELFGVVPLLTPPKSPPRFWRWFFPRSASLFPL
jgi:hypothetical protein